MSEAILAGSQLTVTLSTSDQVELTALQNGTTLVGTYTVSATDNSSDLAVSSFSLTDASGNSDSVIDAFGNAMSATTLPGSQNLSDNAQLLIDNIPIAAARTALAQQSTANAGDTIAVTFTEAVKNTAALTTEITGDAAYGAVGSAATTAWSSDSKTMTITLGTGETVADAHSIAFASVLDLADNENTSITFTVDIA
tara:strand:+ start:113 stop:703 length:591 start_codon:yes stop_codon:yes gene_type:complete